MEKANDLYNAILSLVYNILKNAKLRKEMITNTTLKDYVITQINDILGLEEDFKINKIDGNKLSVLIAQVVVNQLGTEIQIEKPDKSSIDDFQNNYNNLIKYIDENFPNLMFSDILNNNEIINYENIKTLPKFIEDQNNDIKNSKINSEVINNNNSINNNKNNSSNINSQRNNENKNNNYFNSNNSSTTINGGINPSSLGLPPNPIFNSKFYPYKTKPKIMIILKKLLFIFYLILAISILSIYFYSSKNLGLDVYTNSAQTEFSLKSSDDYPTKIFLTQRLFGGLIFPFIFVLVLIFLGFSVFNQKNNAKKEKYHISNMIVWSSLILLIFGVYYIVIYAINPLFSQSLTKIYQSVKWDDSSSGELLNNEIKNLINSTAFKIINYSSIATLLISLALITIFILILIYNPKIDQQKIRRAQYEYQKLIEAKFKGEDYQMDPSLFDNDEEDTK